MKLKTFEIALIEQMASQLDMHLMHGACNLPSCRTCNPDLVAMDAEAINARWREFVDGQ